MPQPVRKTSNLRKGRISVPGARYFLTGTVENRANSFSSILSRETALEEVDRMATEGDWEPLNACIMPDHFHLVCVWTGQASSLSRTIAKYKTRIRRAIGWENLLWQENVFEHRLRPEEDFERYALYIFLNPYRAGLIQPGEQWDGYRCWKPERLRFHQAGVDDADNVRLWIGDNSGKPWES